tara:strand:+ start:222 stop:413 length:192 start_codon:yes stop_codon:yes gene_type:complete
MTIIYSILAIILIGVIGWLFIGEPSDKMKPYDPSQPEYKAPSIAPNYRSDEPLHDGVNIIKKW